MGYVSVATPLLALAALLLLACDRNVERYDPAEEPRPPDLARLFQDETLATAATSLVWPSAASFPKNRSIAARRARVALCRSARSETLGAWPQSHRWALALRMISSRG